MTKNERSNYFEQLKQSLEEKGYKGKPVTVSVFWANVLALVTSAPFIIATLVLYVSLHLQAMKGQSSGVSSLVLLGVLIVSIIVHEALHGLGWSLFASKGWKSISFGIIWKFLTPYCSCNEPLSYKRYLFGGLLPFLVLGVLPGLVSIAIGNGYLLVFSLFNYLAAGGDLLIVWMLLKHRKAVIVDHPTECGFWAFELKRVCGRR